MADLKVLGYIAQLTNYALGDPLVLKFVILATTVHVLLTNKRNYSPLFNPLSLSAEFIIVGSGSGGATLGGRLVPDYEVLQIEAGKTPPPESIPPQFFTTMLRTKDYDWAYQSKEDGVCEAEENGMYWLPSGKVVGGSTSVNLMFFVQGFLSAYAEWAEKYMCDGWTTDEIPNPDRHSQSGPVCISPYDTPSNIDFFAKAGSELVPSIDTVPDINGGYEGECFVEVEGTQCDGERSSADEAYIVPIKDNPKYTLNTEAIVTKVLFNANKKAIGVEFVKNGMKYTAHATKEVIVCAGAIQTPTLLQLSGVGDTAVLTKYNIPVVVESPLVGQNMYDHFAIWWWIEFTKDLSITTMDQIVAEILQYNLDQSGQFAGIGTLPSISFLRSNPNGLVNFESYYLYFKRKDIGLPEVVRCLNYKPIIKDAIMTSLGKNAGALIVDSLLRPKSSGYVTISDKKGVDAILSPTFKFKYLSDEADKTAFLEMARLRRKFFDTPTFQAAGARYIKLPFCFEYDDDTDAFYKCYLKNYSNTVFHAVGTCRMGSVPTEAVCDVDGRVYGATALRVCDASLMPYITTGNTNSPTIMMAEKIADFIKLQYPLPNQ